MRALLLSLLCAGLLWSCRRPDPPPAADEHAGHPAPAAQGHQGHDAPAAPPDPHAGHLGQPSDRPLPQGHAAVRVPGERQQLIGVRLAVAEEGPQSGKVRANGIVQPVEGREAQVHSKVSGFVERLYVQAVGDQVTSGEPLYELFSQELQVAQEEYLRARKTHPPLAAAAKERMRRWDVPAEHLRAIERRGATRTVTFVAPQSGIVLERGTTEGDFVTADTMLFRIADLSVVWVVAQVYEFEVGRLDEEQPAAVWLQGRSRPLWAKVDYVHPTVDPQSRTVSVRLVVENPEGRLRPGSFAVVELSARAVSALWVPDEAVIDTGVRQVVYLALPDGWFHPVQVQVGQRMEGRAEIRGGLRAGDQVVVGAQFLIDSESRIRASPSGPGHGGH